MALPRTRNGSTITLRARMALSERLSAKRASSTALAVRIGSPVSTTLRTSEVEKATSGACTSSCSKLRATCASGRPSPPVSTRKPRSAPETSTRWSTMISSRRWTCSSLLSARTTRCRRCSRSCSPLGRASGTIVSRPSSASGGGAFWNHRRASPTPIMSPAFKPERSTRWPLKRVPFWLPRTTSTCWMPWRSTRQWRREAFRSSTAMSFSPERPIETSSLSRSRTVRRRFSSRMKRGTASPRGAGGPGGRAAILRAGPLPPSPPRRAGRPATPH
jgi:hypothetical protein